MAKKCGNSSKCLKRNPSEKESKLLKELVNEYLYKEQIKTHSDKEEPWQKDHELYLNGLSDIIDFLCGEPNDAKRKATHNYKYNGHQNHLQSYYADVPVVDMMTENLKGIDTKSFKNFDELYEYVKDRKVKYFGNTCVYDFALRYGWKHVPRIEPKEYVYVHAHPLKSAKHLAKLGYISSEVNNQTYRIPFEDFSEEIRQPGMTAADIEHFLCIYRDEILRMRK